MELFDYVGELIRRLTSGSIDLPGDWQQAWSQLWHLGLALLLALPIGWDREKHKRDLSAGVRTFPLIAVAACGIFLVGESFAAGEPEALGRIVYGIVTGVGFLGGGAILKESGQVTGLTTAASMWNTAAIGLAVGADVFVVAFALAIVNVVLLKVRPDKSKPPGHEPPPAKPTPG